MAKGKFGITLGAVAVLAFALAFFNFTEVLVLVVGYALIAEGSNWLTKQTLQALYLRIALSVVLMVIGWIFTGFNFLLGAGRLYGAASVTTSVQTVIDGLLNILMLAACVVAVIRVARDKDANLPLFGSLADKSLGLFTKKAASGSYPPPQQPAPAQYTAPVKPAAPAQPAAPVKPAAPAEPVAPAQPAAPATWTCSCGRENTGKFCAACGAKNPNLN